MPTPQPADTSCSRPHTARGRARARLSLASAAPPQGRLAQRRGPEELRQRLNRYARSHRLTLQALAAEHPAYEDLLFSCPAVAVSLAARRGSPADRGEALHLIRRGAPLLQALATLELPHWLRKLPPEAFTEAPADPFPSLRASPLEAFDPKEDGEFGRRAVNLAPPHDWGGWLRWCVAARRAGGDAFALWLLSQRLRWSRALPERVIGPIAAFAWFSARPDLPAAAHLPRLWTPELALTATMRHTRRWLLQLISEMCAPAPESPWNQSRKVRGYKIDPLTEPDAFVEEGIAMKNCLASYAEAAAEGRCRIYALRRGGRSVANLELRPSVDGRAPVVKQFLGRRNARPSRPAGLAVQEWMTEIMEELAQTPDSPRRVADPFAPPEPDHWRLLFSPLMEARPGAKGFIAPLMEDPRWALDALARFSRLTRGHPDPFD